MKSNNVKFWFKILVVTIIFSAISVYVAFIGTHYIFSKMKPDENIHFIRGTISMIHDIQDLTHKDVSILVTELSKREGPLKIEIASKSEEEYFNKNYSPASYVKNSLYIVQEEKTKAYLVKYDENTILKLSENKDFGLLPPPRTENIPHGESPSDFKKRPKMDFPDGQPDGYRQGPPFKAPFGKNGPGRNLFFIPVLLTFLILFLILLCTTIVFVIVSKKLATQTKNVITELKLGNLKSRLPLSKFDELSGLGNEFNAMADEIEKLVIDLKDTDSNRRHLLQELGHDLRTPIASIKNMLETNLNFDERMTTDERRENLKLSIKEIDYFHHLVDDLLFLSGVHDLKYRGNFKGVNLNALLMHEVMVFEEINPKLEIELHANENAIVMGDEFLLQRLLKNAISNATNYAKNRVDIYVRKIEDRGYEIAICDDGKGINEEIISTFGQKRFSRKMIDEETGKISIGLGSVIMKKICEIHSANIKIKNRKKDDTVIGACLYINFEGIYES